MLQKLLGSVNERKIRPYKAIVQRINALEPVTEALSDEALKQRTRDFRQQVANGASLLDVLPEAFATVREASKRTLGMRHFDVRPSISTPWKAVASTS
jgi:preprotein translocase subunit SecA